MVMLQKSRLDSVEKELLLVIDQYVKEAKDLLKNKQIIEASGKIQEIFDQVFEDFELASRTRS